LLGLFETPLDDGLVHAADTQKVLALTREGDLGHVLAVAEERARLVQVVDHRVPVNVDVSVVVPSRNEAELSALGDGVDMGTIAARREDAVHAPPVLVGLSGPGVPDGLARTAFVLFLELHIPEAELSGAAVGPDLLAVTRPVEGSDEAAVAFEGSVQSVGSSAALVEVDVVVVRANAQIDLGGAVSHALNPLFGVGEDSYHLVEVVAFLESNRTDGHLALVGRDRQVLEALAPSERA